MCGALRSGKLFTTNGGGELAEAHGFVTLEGASSMLIQPMAPPALDGRTLTENGTSLMRPLAMHDLAGCTRMAPGSIWTHLPTL